MARLNAVLLVLLIVSGLSAVNAQHKARKLFVELERTRETAKKLNVEYSQLELEASTWAMHSRIEKIAGAQLNMRVPPPARIQVLTPDAGGGRR